MTTLRLERFKRLMSQQQMAKELDVPPSELSRLENGFWIKCPRRYEAKLTSYFNMSFPELMAEAPSEVSRKDRLEVWRRMKRISTGLKDQVLDGPVAELRRARPRPAPRNER